MEDLRHLEEVRTTVRQRPSMSQERRAAIRKEVVWMLVDITFLFVVLFVANIVHGFELMPMYLESSDLEIIPYIVFIQIIFALLLPATVNIIKRVCRIADIMAARAMGSVTTRCAWAGCSIACSRRSCPSCFSS